MEIIFKTLKDGIQVDSDDEDNYNMQLLAMLIVELETKKQELMKLYERG